MSKFLRKMVVGVVASAAIAVGHSAPTQATGPSSYEQDWTVAMNQPSYWLPWECKKYERHNGSIAAKYDAAIIKDGNKVRVYPDLSSTGSFTAQGATNPANGKLFPAPHSWVMKCTFPVEPPPTTEPPVTVPPTTEPPVTEPPVAEPPVTEPPVTEPPATDPPTTVETDIPPVPPVTLPTADECSGDGVTMNWSLLPCDTVPATPPASPPEPSETAPGPQVTELPATGTETTTMILLATLLLALGYSALKVARR